MTEDGARQRERVAQAIRALASAQSEMGRMFARSEQMHVTDAAAIVEILTAEERDRPLTPARLAERIGLTTGATSALLNRLEEAGHIVRTREHHDRRVVTLRSTAAIHAASDAFFIPLYRRVDAVMSDYSEAELDLVEKVVGRLRDVMSAYASSSGPTAPDA